MLSRRKMKIEAVVLYLLSQELSDESSDAASFRLEIMGKSWEIIGTYRNIKVFLRFLFCISVHYYLFIGLNWSIDTLELLLILCSVK